MLVGTVGVIHHLSKGKEIWLSRGSSHRVGGGRERLFVVHGAGCVDGMREFAF